MGSTATILVSIFLGLGVGLTSLALPYRRGYISTALRLLIGAAGATVSVLLAPAVFHRSWEDPIMFPVAVFGAMIACVGYWAIWTRVHHQQLQHRA